MTGAYRITVNPGSSDLPPTTALNRFIDPDHERALRRKRRDEQPEEDATGAQARPHATVQDPVIRLEGPHMRKAHDPQNGGDHTLPWHEDRSHHPGLGRAARHALKLVEQTIEAVR